LTEIPIIIASTGIAMNLKTYSPSLLIILIAVASISLFQASHVAAEDMPETEAQILTDGASYTGTLNSINAQQSILIIDDRSFVLDRVIRFNNASWSREQVLNRLKPESRVEIVMGQIVDASRGARLIESLRVLD
jgi:hypothetical protein